MAVGAIEPVPPGTKRPFWSVMIPTYNCASLLERSLGSVLAQDPGPDEMQIMVVDDASVTDDPEAVCRRVGGDRVEFQRQAVNVGAPANFTACVRLARGHWVHILHGDDAVLPGFYETYRRTVDATPCVMAVGQAFTVDERDRIMGVTPPLDDDGAGHLAEAHALLATRHPVAFVAVVCARSALEQVGGFDDALPHANDWELWTRLALAGPVAVVPTPLSLYRQHAGSDTTRLSATTAYRDDAVSAMEVITARFGTADERARAGRQCRSLLSGLALSVARDHAAAGRRRRALAEAAWALRTSPSARSSAGAAEVLMVVATDTARRHRHRYGGGGGGAGAGPDAGGAAGTDG